MLRRALLTAPLLLACSSSASTPPAQAPDTYHRPSVPSGALLLESPEYTLPGGQETVMCAYTNITLPANFDTREVHSYQMAGGHHAIVYYTYSPQAPGIHPCTEDDMANFRLVGGGAESNEQGVHLPEGLAIRIPAGVQLGMQLHYVNMNPQDRRVRDAITVYPADPANIQHFADGFAMSDGDFAIPPHAAYGRSIECAIQSDMNIVNMIGHTHQYGHHLRISRIPAGGAATDMLYDEVAGARLQFTPPQRQFTTANPLVFHTGDRVRLDCDWVNTSNQTLRFPSEMCATFMYYYPGQGFISCGDVVETRGAVDTPDAGTTHGNAGCSGPPAASDPCVRSCNTGNELGVGKYCTPGGNQCRGNGSAVLCTADFDNRGPGFCTKGCSDDTGCGSGAVCQHDTSGSGCLPVECAGPSSDAGSGSDAAPAADAAGAGDGSSG